MSEHRAFYGEFSFEEERRRAAFENRIAGLEKKIAKNGRHELEVLEGAGVDRKAMLRFLAFVADEEGDKSWADPMRARQRALKSIAGRMETLARDAEERASDPFSVVRTWAFFTAHGHMLGMRFPEPLKSDSGVSFAISGMRVLAKRWKDEAKRFGRFLDRYADRRVNPGVPILLWRVCVYMRKLEPDHWEELANLLTDAFEAAGKSKRFSADWLRKTWKKRGKTMLLLWLKLNTETPPKVNPTLPPISPPVPAHRLGSPSHSKPLIDPLA
jgi:hypothetical protein